MLVDASSVAARGYIYIFKSFIPGPMLHIATTDGPHVRDLT
jgi:hypothetical protein